MYKTILQHLQEKVEKKLDVSLLERSKKGNNHIGTVLLYQDGQDPTVLYSVLNIDFNLFGHQVVAHLSPNEVKTVEESEVDGKMVPVRHFGVILKWDQWHEFANTLQAKKIKFIIEPYVRFKGESGEQATMFFLDPSGNALEFKSFKNQSSIFEK